MLKSLFASCAVLATGSAAVAGPFVNVETNAGFLGSDYRASTTDLHVGYEGESGVFGWYVQGGPSLVSVDGDDFFTDDSTEVELSGKIGATIAATEKLGIYGELSGMTGDYENAYGLKAGAKYSF